MQVTDPTDYPQREAVPMVLQMLKETKHPIGFARDWPKETPKKKRKKKRA